MTTSKSASSVPVSEFLFSFKGVPTQIVSFGDTPLGQRLDIHFDGEVEGPKLNGTLSGVDHGLIRLDGVMEIDVRGALVTQDGANISVAIKGYLLRGDTIRDTNVKLVTGDQRYSWLNDKIIVGEGKSTPGEGLQISYFYRP